METKYMPDYECEWKSQYDPDYKCDEPALPGDPQGYCILHSCAENKSLNEFTDKVLSRIEKFGRKADLSGWYFPRGFYVKEIARNTRLSRSEHVIFCECTFLEEADFSGATYSNADFRGTRFSEKADFTKTIFQGFKINFRVAKFEGDVIFSDTQFRSEEISFSETEFIEKGEVDFYNPHFHGQVYFIGTKFKKRCKFRWAEFPRTEKQPVFEDTNLQECSFLYSNIDKVDFRNCSFGEEREYLLGFVPIGKRPNVLFDEKNAKTKLEFDMAGRVYRDLEKNFNEKGDRRTACDFYYGEMECKRKQIGWKELCLSLYNLLHVLSRHITGYGVRLERSLLSLWLLIVVSCLFYKYHEGIGWGQATSVSLFGINVLLATVYNCAAKFSHLGQLFFWFQVVAGTFLTTGFVLTFQRVFTPFK